MMQEDPENRTRWKHKWRWHNRGTVWDKMATRWAVRKKLMLARKEQTSLEDKVQVQHLHLERMKLPTEHRQTENKDKQQRLKKKTPRDLGLKGIAVHTRDEGSTVHFCGDSKWINGEFDQGTKYKETTGKNHRILHSWWKRRDPAPISDIDNFVKHFYREQPRGRPLG